MSRPLLEFPREVPNDLREWGRWLFDFNKWFKTDGDKAIVDNTATLDTRTTTDFGTVLTYIGDTGQAVSQRLLNQIAAGNKQSTQSAQPVTATDSGGGLAAIAIASHSVQFGFGAVAYNSGSINGLLNSTLYYVYADDPTYAGGAVTYLSTTNANNITANSGRYYVGKITTPAGGGGGTSGGWGGGGGGGGTQIP